VSGHDKGRPGEEAAPRVLDEATVRRQHLDDQRARGLLRAIWLRYVAMKVQARGLDPSGAVAAQLLDFADTLEMLDDEGRWDG
jgi:hypothetical protein